MSLFYSKKPVKTILLFSIESGIIRAGIVVDTQSECPTLVYNTHVEIPFQENLEFSRLVLHLHTCLTHACEKILRQGIPHITDKKLSHNIFDEIYCIYGSPWYVSQTKTISIKKDKPFHVSREVIDALITEQTSNLIKDYTNQGSASEETDSVLIIERNIIDIRLNGYVVGEPWGKDASDIEMKIFVSVMSDTLKRSVEDVIMHFFSAHSITHQSMPMIVFSGIRDTLSKESDFLLVDVSAEVTDISHIYNNVVMDIVSFPHGTNSIIRTISQMSGRMPQESFSLLKKAYREVHHPEIESQYQKVMEAAEQLWLAAFEQALAKMFHGKILPHTVFLLVNENNQQFLAALIAKEQYAQGSRTLRKFSVTAISPSIVRAQCSLGGGARGDAVLMLAGQFVHKVHG